MKPKEKFYVMIAVDGKTVCENKYGYSSEKEAKVRARMWLNDGFEVGILKM